MSLVCFEPRLVRPVARLILLCCGQRAGHYQRLLAVSFNALLPGPLAVRYTLGGCHSYPAGEASLALL